MSDIPEGCIKPSFKVGDMCVCDATAAFRSGKPFRIIGISVILTDRKEWIIRYLYIKQYEDGLVDSMPISGEKEYRMRKVL